jgi:hypothetical protein
VQHVSVVTGVRPLASAAYQRVSVPEAMRPSRIVLMIPNSNDVSLVSTAVVMAEILVYVPARDSRNRLTTAAVYVLVASQIVTLVL